MGHLTSQQMGLGVAMVLEHPRRPGEGALQYIARLAVECGWVPEIEGLPRFPAGDMPTPWPEDWGQGRRARAEAQLPRGDRTDGPEEWDGAL